MLLKAKLSNFMCELQKKWELINLIPVDNHFIQAKEFLFTCGCG